MSQDTEHDDSTARLDEEVDIALRRAWHREPGEIPPGDFAERVMSAASDPSARARRPAVLMAVAAIAAAAVLAVFVLALRLWPPSSSSEDAYEARDRLSVGLRGRGVAVLEPGAQLRWAPRDGRPRWEQARGAIFFRIDKGTPLIVSTPAGDVAVLGTCFRVEVDPMTLSRQSKAAFGLGAALAAAVVVTVDEGRVRLANGKGQIELGPGEQGSLSATTPPQKEAQPALPAGHRLPPPAFLPPPGASEGELRERIDRQEKELAELRATAARKRESEGSYVNPSREELLARVGRCEIRYDYPQGLDHSRPPTLTAKEAKRLGLSAGQQEAYDEAVKQVYSAHEQTLRQLYKELTGDEKAAQQMPPGELLADIRDRGAEPRINRKLAEELAGLAAPPADVSNVSVRERLLRHMLTVGDEYERKIAEVIGPEQAHKLRTDGNGWGAKSIYNGCPGH